MTTPELTRTIEFTELANEFRRLIQHEAGYMARGEDCLDEWAIASTHLNTFVRDNADVFENALRSAEQQARELERRQGEVERLTKVNAEQEVMLDAADVAIRGVLAQLHERSADRDHHQARAEQAEAVVEWVRKKLTTLYPELCKPATDGRTRESELYGWMHVVCSRASGYPTMERIAVEQQKKAEQLQRERDEAVAMAAELRDIEWAGMGGRCPDCSHIKEHGHAMDCKLAYVLDCKSNPGSAFLARLAAADEVLKLMEREGYEVVFCCDCKTEKTIAMIGDDEPRCNACIHRFLDSITAEEK